MREQRSKAMQEGTALLFGAAGLFCAAATLLGCFAFSWYSGPHALDPRATKSPKASQDPSALRLRF